MADLASLPGGQARCAWVRAIVQHRRGLDDALTRFLADFGKPVQRATHRRLGKSQTFRQGFEIDFGLLARVQPIQSALKNGGATILSKTIDRHDVVKQC